jgi:metal transporter CNNM
MNHKKSNGRTISIQKTSFQAPHWIILPFAFQRDEAKWYRRTERIEKMNFYVAAVLALTFACCGVCDSQAILFSRAVDTPTPSAVLGTASSLPSTSIPDTTSSSAAATTVAPEEGGTTHAALTRQQMALYLAADVVLLGFAALFAGLTLAVMGLDTLSLEIIADSGKDPDKTYAQQILPLRTLGNQLLCTLILGNVMVNTLIAQITDRVLVGWFATVASTALITLGGEIIPQATMSAHALYVGSKSAPIVKLFLILFYPICKPVAMFLDRVLGTDPGQIYERNELKKLMFLHATAHGSIGMKELGFMMGALEIHEKTVGDVMTPLHEIFMLEAAAVLDEIQLRTIWEAGHSRIPVYKGKRTEIVGVLFTKDLIGIRPSENLSVLTVAKFYGRTCHVVPSETKLVTVLRYFQSGKSHMAFVQGVTTSKPGSTAALTPDWFR